MDENTFAKRTGWSQQMNRITQAVEDLKEKGSPVLDLTVSNPTASGITYPSEQILEALRKEENLSYRPKALGLKNARRAVADYYKEKGFSVDPDRIVITSSSSESYSFLFRLLANYGDHVLFPRPSYPLFSFLTDLNDINQDHYRLDEANGWRIDMDDLSSKTESFTKAIVCVNPNNPTGSFLQQDEKNTLNKFCASFDLPIISDEVFWDYILEGDNNRASLIDNKEVLSFTLGGLSKSFGLPQMKIGWIIVNGPDAKIQKALGKLEVIADTFLSPNIPAQNALTDWLGSCRSVQEEIQERIHANYSFLKKQLISLKGCRLYPPCGGWYAVLKVSSRKPEEDWVLKLLNKYHVLVHPGFFYDFDQQPVVVLSLLPDPEIFHEGILRFLSRIEQEVS